MKAYSILGNSQKLDGGAMFGNAPKALWERWLPADSLNRIDLSCRCLLINDAGRLILFETGIGSFFSPKYKERYGVVEDSHVLLDNLAKLGIDHTDVDVIVLSHLHFDHAGGLLSPYRENVDAQLLFPNATYLIGEKAWERALNPHLRDRASFIPQLNQLLSESGRIVLVDSKHSTVLGDRYSFHFSDGHTPGLMITEIKGNHMSIFFPSDLIPGRAWVHRSITMGYDRYPELLIDEKIEFLDYVSQQNGHLFFTHDASCAIAKINRNGHQKFGSVHIENEVFGLSI